MLKKEKIEKKKLLFTGATGAKYMDEYGQHGVKPGDTVEFSPAMYKFHVAEPVWKALKIKDGE